MPEPPQPWPRPPTHTNCRCMDIERLAIQAGDHVRYNGQVVQVTETRLSANGEHILTISGTGLVGLDPNRHGEMQVSCDRTEHIDEPIPGSLRAEVESLQERIRRAEAAEGIGASTSRPALEAEANVLLGRMRRSVLITDDINDDGSLPGETAEERVTRQRAATARWMTGHVAEAGDEVRIQGRSYTVTRDEARQIVEAELTGNDHRDEVEGRDVLWERDEASITMPDIERWAAEQRIDGERIEVWGGQYSGDHITIGVQRDGFMSSQRISQFQLVRARDPYMLLRVAAECAVRALHDVIGRVDELDDQPMQTRTVEQLVSVNMLDAESAAQRLRDAAADLGLSAGEAVGNMGNMTRAMRQWEMQYTNRPGVFTGLTPPDPESAEYGPEEFDFENEQRW